MTKEEAKKILTEDFHLVSTEILKEAAEKILSELVKSEEKISELEKKIIAGRIENLPGEIWKDIEGFEGLYQVSNMGRVKSFHFKRNLILNPGNVNGYLEVSLYKPKTNKKRLVHILVAKAFIANPENLPEVNHKDGNKSNNRVENLEWVTSSQNKFHAIKSKLNPSAGVTHYRAKFNAEEIKYIRKNYKPCDKKFGGKALAEKFKVDTETIYKIVKYKTYKNIE